MQELSDILSSLGAWIWFIVGCGLLMLELVVPGVHFLWFGLAAILFGTIMVLMSGLAPEYAAMLDWPYQLIIYAALSTAIVFQVRRYSIGMPSSEDGSTLNARSAQYVGRTVVVTVPLVNGRGKVRIGDTQWIAKGADAPVGARVKVVGFDGPVLLVEPA